MKLISKSLEMGKPVWGKKRLMQWESTKSDPFKSLIGTVLSQRTRDENTAMATERLFNRYDTPEGIANAKASELERLIRPSGFYKVKARRIKQISRLIIDRYGGKVPDDMDVLCSIPGVGRKTAGCVLVYAFGKPAIPVDTHVHRVANRIGIVKSKSPDKTEQALLRAVPRRYWIMVNDLLVRFGKKVCRPVGPRCAECPVNKYCDYYKNVYVEGKP